MDTVNVMGVPDTARRATEEDRVEPEPDTYFDGWRDEGHQRLCRTVRHELEQHGPAWARSIDDEALLDPLLVTTTSHPDSGLELPQCLWGLVPPRHRPSSMSVRAFEDGRVLLPGLGTLRGPEPFGRATLHVVDDEPRLREHPDARLEPLPRAGPIVVYPYRHPWLRPYTDLHGKHYADTRVEEPTRHNLSSLTEAMELLEATSPRQHAELGRDLRLAIIVHQPALASMAGLPIHGAVFLSVRGHESPIFFVEELVHQGGHVTFSKVIADWSKVLAIPYATPMSRLTGDEDDPRPFGDAVHGNYTLVRMVLALEALLDYPLVRGHLRHEVLGRVALSLVRLEVGLQQIDHPGLYHERGWLMHRRFVGAYERMSRRLGWVRARVEVRDQPYVFEYDRFLAANPL